MTENKSDYIAQLESSGYIKAGSLCALCLPFEGGEQIAEQLSALGAAALSLEPDMSYGRIKAAMDSAQPQSYVGLPGVLLSILRACGKGSIQRAIVCGDACPNTVLNEIEDILGSRVIYLDATGEGADEEMAALDAKLFSLGALVDCSISRVSGGYRMEGIYKGWMDPRQMGDVCPRIIAVKLRELSMDDAPLYKGRRTIL